MSAESITDGPRGVRVNLVLVAGSLQQAPLGGRLLEEKI
jgi:hypothetical protein